MFCILVGALSLIVGFFVKFIPLELFSFLQFNVQPLSEEEKEHAFKSSLRKSRSLYRQSSRNLGVNISRSDSRRMDNQHSANVEKIKQYRKQSSKKL